MSDDHVMSTPESEVLVERNGRVGIITLNRPAVLNAITINMANLYASALRELDSDSAVRAIVVTGAGRGFCSGADLSVLRGGAPEVRAFLPPRENLPDIALRLRKPVVMAVNGPVAGIGFAYMMYSDVRFAAADATISTTFASLGLVAEYGLSWLLPRIVGVANALDLFLSARTITGLEAQQLGVVQYSVRDNNVLEAAMSYASKLAETCSPASMARMKAQVYGDLDVDAEVALGRTLTLMDESLVHPDLQEAMRARADQRPPRFMNVT